MTARTDRLEFAARSASVHGSPDDPVRIVPRFPICGSTDAVRREQLQRWGRAFREAGFPPA